MNRNRTASTRAGLLALSLLALLPACRKEPRLPSVPDAKAVVPFSAVILFRETPVSSAEFDAADRRWTLSSSPRFDEGRLRTRPGPDGGTITVEIPPAMAFKNRGADCGTVDDRRVCVLPWDQAEITLCGRPFDGHLEIENERLADSGLLVCRVVTPAHEEPDGGWAVAERDCTEARRIRLKTIDSADLQFRIGDVALVADPGGSPDRTVCDQVAQAIAPPGP